MKTIEAIKTLTEWDQRQRSVFKMTDLRMLFPEPSEKHLVKVCEGSFG